MIKFGIKFLDEVFGGVKEYLYILFYEEDFCFFGCELVFEFMKNKFENDNLVGFFNISYVFLIFIEIMKKRGINVDEYFDLFNLVIVDIFGSFYGLRIERCGVWYFLGFFFYEFLFRKYVEVVRVYKEFWKKENMFEGRELWGVVMDFLEYLNIFGEVNVLSYFEVFVEIRRCYRVYREYLMGINIWVFFGKFDCVFLFFYRRVDYVVRMRSEFIEEGVKCYMCIFKVLGVFDVILFEYLFIWNGIEMKRID